MKERSIIAIALIFSVLILPTWVPLSVAVALIYFYPNYYEAVVLGLLVDLLYAREHSTILGLYSFGMLALYIGIQFVKPYIRRNDF